MSVSSIRFSMPHRLTRDAAFAEQGVELSLPGRSLSGLRAEDDSVVIAIDEADVIPGAAGSRCLLWTPKAAGWAHDAVLRERLEHCRQALRHGVADGLLVSKMNVDVERGQVLNLRVERRAAEYWAAWGSPAVVPGIHPLEFPALRAFGRLAA